MLFNELRPWHLIILVVVFLALFGYKKLPDATRSVGRSLRIFKSEMKGLHEDEPEEKTEPASAAAKPPVIEGTPVRPKDAAKSDATSAAKPPSSGA
jgi:sec-independent protein translocase protein TatA